MMTVSIKTATTTALAALIAVSATGSADAQDFSEGSQAKKWPLQRTELARFEGKVVDIICELTGDCPENCGDGKRHLGIVRKADGVLVLANKNTQPIFTGAVSDLLPYCNQEVEVDGQLAGFDENHAKLYQIQLIRKLGDADFAKTNRFTKDWAKRFPDAEGKGPWFQRDPRVLAEIEKTGYLGIGVDAEKEFVDDEIAE